MWAWNQSFLPIKDHDIQFTVGVRLTVLACRFSSCKVVKLRDKRKYLLDICKEAVKGNSLLLPSKKWFHLLRFLFICFLSSRLLSLTLLSGGFNFLVSSFPFRQQSVHRLGFQFFSIFVSLLDASTHLYKRLCPSVRPLVRPSVRRSVTRFSNIAEMRTLRQ